VPRAPVSYATCSWSI